MTKLLDSAFREVETLSQVEQNMFAKFIIDEITSKKRWDEEFTNSEDTLTQLADEALVEFDLENTELLNTNNLC